MEITEAARGRGLIERWCQLAEQRLEYLTELFETGRWRRYFGEVAFLDNIQEAKQAVETWRGLLNREASADNRPIDLSWLGRRSTLPPRRLSFLADAVAPVVAPIALGQPYSPSPPISLAAVTTAPPQPDSPPAIITAPAKTQSLAPQQAEPWELALDPERLQQRYPLLRNAF